MMSVQNDTLGRRLDVDLDLHKPLKAKSTAKLQVEQLNVVVYCLDADLVNLGSLSTGFGAYVSGKMFRSAAAIVVTDLRRSAIRVEGKGDFEYCNVP